MKNKHILRPIIYMFSSFFSILWLSMGNSFQYIDYKIVTASIFSFLVNNVFLYFQYKDINIYHSIYDYSVIRVTKNKYIDLIVRKIIYNTFVVIVFGYILPVTIFFTSFYNLIFYVIYLAVLYLLFLAYDMMILYSFELENKFLKLSLRIIPFILNIVIQINFFQFFYEKLGGLL